MKKDDFAKSIQEFMEGRRDLAKLSQELPDGYMELTVCYVLPGIFLACNDVHAKTVPCNKENMPEELLLINYCMQGRCEFKVDEDGYNYVDNNMMNITTQMAQDYFYYPSSYYVGYEIYVLPVMFTEETEKALLEAMDNKDIAVILMTEKLIDLIEDKVNELKLIRPSPIISEIPDRHADVDVTASISRYVQEAIGIKL